MRTCGVVCCCALLCTCGVVHCCVHVVLCAVVRCCAHVVYAGTWKRAVNGTSATWSGSWMTLSSKRTALHRSSVALSVCCAVVTAARHSHHTSQPPQATATTRHSHTHHSHTSQHSHHTSQPHVTATSQSCDMVWCGVVRCGACGAMVQVPATGSQRRRPGGGRPVAADGRRYRTRGVVCAVW